MQNLESGAAPVAQAAFPIMGTVVSIHIEGAAAQACLNAAVQLIQNLNALLSHKLPDSDIALLNQGSDQWQQIQPDTQVLLAQAIECNAKTQGAYHPGMGAVIRLWDQYICEPEILPDATEISQLLAGSSADNISCNEAGNYRLKNSTQINLGGIAKGYVAQRVQELCRNYDIVSALIDLGSSSIAAVGMRDEGHPWRVGLRVPDAKSEELYGAVLLDDRVLSTSADDQKSVVLAGKRFHHIIDPRTGYPAQGDVRAATVLAVSGAVSEAYSTAALILGAEAILRLHEEQRDFAAIMYTQDAQLIKTPDFENIVLF